MIRGVIGAVIGASLGLASASAQASHEPPDMKRLTSRAFSSIADGDDGWTLKINVQNSLTLVQDSTAPKSPGSVARITYPAGFVGGDGLARTCRAFSGAEQKRTIYIAAWVQLAPNFEGHPNSFINKILYVYLNGRKTDVAIEAAGGGLDPLQPMLMFQNLAAPYPDSYGVAGATVGRVQNVTSGAQIVRGKWTQLEYVFTANTPGYADGSIDAWQDGVQTHHLPNISFVPAGASGLWEEVCWDPIWGGVAGTVTQTFWMEMDHIFVSGK